MGVHVDDQHAPRLNLTSASGKIGGLPLHPAGALRMLGPWSDWRKAGGAA
jgi:hypothetical protein